MARPRNICFYEETLPAVLPDGQEWLQSYHENSRKLVEHMVKNGAGSTVYHTAIRFFFPCFALMRWRGKHKHK